MRDDVKDLPKFLERCVCWLARHGLIASRLQHQWQQGTLGMGVSMCGSTC